MFNFFIRSVRGSALGDAVPTNNSRRIVRPLVYGCQMEGIMLSDVNYFVLCAALLIVWSNRIR